MGVTNAPPLYDCSYNLAVSLLDIQIYATACKALFHLLLQIEAFPGGRAARKEIDIECKQISGSSA